MEQGREGWGSDVSEREPNWIKSKPIYECNHSLRLEKSGDIKMTVQFLYLCTGYAKVPDLTGYLLNPPKNAAEAHAYAASAVLTAFFTRRCSRR